MKNCNLNKVNKTFTLHPSLGYKVNKGGFMLIAGIEDYAKLIGGAK